MDFELQKTLLDIFEDFARQRTNVAVFSLRQDREYLKISARRNQLHEELCQVSEKVKNYSFELDDLMGAIINFETIAAYKQGFSDAKEIIDDEKNRHHFFPLQVLAPNTGRTAETKTHT